MSGSRRESPSQLEPCVHSRRTRSPPSQPGLHQQTSRQWFARACGYPGATIDPSRPWCECGEERAAAQARQLAASRHCACFARPSNNARFASQRHFLGSTIRSSLLTRVLGFHAIARRGSTARSRHSPAAHVAVQVFSRSAVCAAWSKPFRSGRTWPRSHDKVGGENRHHRRARPERASESHVFRRTAGLREAARLVSS